MQWFSLLGAVISAAAVAIAYRLGYAAGYSAGKESGYEDGKREGAKEGTARGYAVGYDRGKRVRHAKGGKSSEGGQPNRKWHSKLLFVVAAVVIVVLWATQGRKENRLRNDSASPVTHHRPLGR